MVQILYIGSAKTDSTAFHRSQALVRLGNKVDVIAPLEAVKNEVETTGISTIHYRTGYRLLQSKVANWLRRQLVNGKQYDLVWVDSGEFLGNKCIRILKETLRCPVILYNIDDPTGKRDGGRFASLRKALPAYDLVVVVRPETKEECWQLGAKNVLQVSRSYDELAHQPFEKQGDIPERFRSDVAFIGTWMPNEDRDVFMLELIKNGVPLSIWGDGWQKSSFFSKLRSYWRGPAVYGRDYVAAVQGARVCVGMLSKGNRDLHTTRSLEIPFIGGLFCAERTAEHTAMYKEGEQAFFWKDADECASVCNSLMANENKREQVRLAGMQRVREMHVGNEDICRIILTELKDTIFARRKKLLVVDTHPVQYRVPIWKAMASMYDGDLQVVYASDCSVRGHLDQGFGQTVAWDEPMLTGYHNTVLNCEKGQPLVGWKSLTGDGIEEIFDRVKPDYIMLTGINYRYDLKAYRLARKRKIPLWLRCETQDEAFTRAQFKSYVRSLIYRTVYRGFDRFFYIGTLNRQHYEKHGVPASKLSPALYGTVDRYEGIGEDDKHTTRALARSRAGLSATNLVIGFSGKFIEKKNPAILFSMLKFLPPSVRQNTVLYFIGSGGLESELRQKAADALEKYGVKTHFAGFVNQSKIAGHYLALDILVLPSKRMGETWGLVANEAMQAGCGVIVSDAVGCSVDFQTWERFRVFYEGNAQHLAECAGELAAYSTDFNWARKKLEPYSIQTTARALLEAIG